MDTTENQAKVEAELRKMGFRTNGTLLLDWSDRKMEITEAYIHLGTARILAKLPYAKLDFAREEGGVRWSFPTRKAVQG